LDIQQTIGEDFERKIKAIMRIGMVFQGQHHWVQNEAHLLRAQSLTEQLVIVHNRRCQLELSKSNMNHIVHSSILHDIGKAEIPEWILYKPEPLSPYERIIIEMHPLMGSDILNKISREINNDVISSLEVADHITSIIMKIGMERDIPTV
jgi:response regulator RpfG family c-di-GMP phosphodiesterase